jgi:hypothetical protein
VPVQQPGVAARPVGQCGHAVSRQWPRFDPAYRGPGQRPDQRAEPGGVVRRVVPEAQHEQHRQVSQPAPDVPQHVDRRVVGPVDVLDHQRGRAAAGQLGDGRVVHGVAVALHQRLLQRSAGARGRIEQRAERTRGAQVVAAAAEHPQVVAGLVEERPDHAGLPDPGLAGHQHRAAPPGHRHLAGGGQQHPDVGVAFEQRHGHAPAVRRHGPRRFAGRDPRRSVRIGPGHSSYR